MGRKSNGGKAAGTGPGRDFLQRPASHVTDERGRRHFANCLPAEWVVNPLGGDYGKDYHVEVDGPDGRVPGAFYVQLKSTGRCRYVGGGAEVSFPLERRHLGHYVDEVKLPVFLVVVDVPAGKGFWLFLHRHLAGTTDWRRSDTHTVRIPVGNRLEAAAGFAAAVAEAFGWMLLFQQKPAQERAADRIRELRVKDPRFDVEVTYSETAERLRLIPTESVKLLLRFTPRRKRLVARMRADLFDRGLAVGFAPGEPQVEGSALVSEIVAEGGVVQLTARADARLDLSVVNGERVLSTWPGLAGEVTGGLREYRYTSREGRCPLTVSVGPLGTGADASIGIYLDPTVWEGQPVRRLGYFERVRDLFTSLLGHPAVRVACEVDGNPLFSASGSLGGTDRFGPLVAFLEVVRKARQVADHFGIEPVFSVARFDREAVTNIEIAHAVVTAGRYEQGPADWKVDVTFDKRSASALGNGEDVPSDLVLCLDGTDRFPLLDASVDIGRLAWSIPRATLFTPPDELRRRLAGPGDSVTVSFRTPEGQGWVLRPVLDDEWEEIRGRSPKADAGRQRVIVPPPSQRPGRAMRRPREG